eukprot:COSAG01_NODE_5699_length_4090_cov_3.098472_1_plen_130_part_00
MAAPRDAGLGDGRIGLGMDRFADAGNAQLPRFNSGYPSRGAEVVDTFTTSWQRRELNWINPPWQLMDKVMYKLDCEPAAAAVLLAPYWPRASWYPTLSRLDRRALYSRTVHRPGKRTGACAASQPYNIF